MIQTSNLTGESLTGPLAIVLLLALALVLPISFGLIKLYRRAVSKSMGARSGSLTNKAHPLVNSQSLHPPAQSSPDLSVVDAAVGIPGAGRAAALYAEVLHAPWRTAAVYTVAGACYALILTVASFVSDEETEISPLRFVFLFWIYLWPVVLTINLVAAVTRRAKFASVVVYFLIFAAITAVSLGISSQAIWGLPLVWVIYNLPATLLLLAFLNRRVRAVGPLVLIFMLLAVLGSQLALSLLASSEELIRGLVSLATIIGLGARSILLGVSLLGFFIVWPFGWLILRLVRRLYERKKISDQSITLDAVWLLFGFVNSLMLASGAENAIWIFSGLFAFLGFKVVAGAGLGLLGRKTQTRTAPRLLLLRVFSLGKRSEKLFGSLATHWRHVGSIELIAGPDLATNTLEPHEFLDFLSGKLSRRFIDGPQALERRSAEMDTKPDQDGRFRVNDFFCHDDTWQMVLSRLVKETDAVVMDLRGFTSQNKGCVFEVNELINVAPLGQVVFVIDDTTDEHFLLENVLQSWVRMKPTSPNRQSASGQLQLFRFTGSRSGELPQLLRALCIAANPA